MAWGAVTCGVVGAGLYGSGAGVAGLADGRGRFGLGFAFLTRIAYFLLCGVARGSKCCVAMRALTELVR